MYRNLAGRKKHFSLKKSIGWNESKLNTYFSFRNLPFSKRSFSSELNKQEQLVNDTNNLSFIDKAKAKGANAILGLFTTTSGFDSCMKGLRVEKIETGKVICSLQVTKNFLNSYQTLHGGARTMALITENPLKPGVSIELSVSFMNAAKENDNLQIVGRVLKCGKSIGFTQVDFIRVSDGKLIATAKHTKAL